MIYIKKIYKGPKDKDIECPKIVGLSRTSSLFEMFNDDVQDAGRVRAVEFTRDGRDAPFLQLEDSPLASQQVWEAFAGVYGPRAVKSKKFGATVYARYDDQLAESLGQAIEKYKALFHY